MRPGGVVVEPVLQGPCVQFIKGLEPEYAARQPGHPAECSGRPLEPLETVPDGREVLPSKDFDG